MAEDVKGGDRLIALFQRVEQLPQGNVLEDIPRPVECVMAAGAGRHERVQVLISGHRPTRCGPEEEQAPALGGGRVPGWNRRAACPFILDEAIWELAQRISAP